MTHARRRVHLIGLLLAALLGCSDAHEPGPAPDPAPVLTAPQNTSAEPARDAPSTSTPAPPASRADQEFGGGGAAGSTDSAAKAGAGAEDPSGDEMQPVPPIMHPVMKPVAVECGLPSEPGAPVVDACTEHVKLEDLGGGFPLELPEGSECRGERSYQLDVERRELSWSECKGDATTPWKRTMGSRVLSEQELEHAVGGLGLVRVWDGKMACGADKGSLQIEVTTARGMQQYRDSFYACYKFPDALPFVDNIDYGFTILASLVQP